MISKMNEMKGITTSESNWELILDSDKDKVKIEVKRSIRGLLIMRA
jgi:hypothetical protein